MTQVNARGAASRDSAGLSPSVQAMNREPIPTRLFPELWLVILVPLCTLVAGAAMICVATSFGFTALGEPLPTVVDARR